MWAEQCRPLPCTCTLLSQFIISHRHIKLLSLSHHSTRLWRGFDRSQVLKLKSVFESLHFFFALHFAVNMFSRCFAAVGHTLVSVWRCRAMSLRDCHDCRPTSEKSLGQFCYSNWSVVIAGNPCMHDVNDFTIEGLSCTKKRRKGLSVPKNQNAFSPFCAQINLTIISICHWFTAVYSGQTLTISISRILSCLGKRGDRKSRVNRW